MMKPTRRPNFRILRRTLLLSLSLGLAACGGKSTTTETPTGEIANASDTATAALGEMVESGTPTIPSSPVEAPATLMVEAVLANPNAQITELAAFADAIQPGAGAFISPPGLLQVLAGVVELQSLSGVDLNGPLYAIALEGEKVVIIVTVGNEEELNESLDGFTVKKVMHGKFAAIGKADALAVIAPYALSNLVVQELPTLPTVNVHVAKIMKGSQADDMKREMKREMGKAGAKSLIEIFEGVDIIRTSLETAPKAAKVLMVANVLDGPLKGFLATQKPSDFSMVNSIGTGPWSLAAAGRLDISYFVPLLTQLGNDSGEAIAKILLPQVGALKGELAFGMDMLEKSRPEVILGMNLENAKTIKSLIDLAATGGSKKKDLQFSGLPAKLKMSALKSKGNSLHEVKMTPTTKEDKERYGKKPLFAYFGVAKETLIGSYGPQAKSWAKTLMNKSTISGKGQELSKAIAAAKEEKETFIIAMDPMSLQGKQPTMDVEPIVFGLGFTDSTITGRLIFPTSFVKDAAQGGM